MALIREDCYGLYVKSGGYIARPIPTNDTKYCPNITWNSEYRAGDKVKAKHVGSTGTHDVGIEIWSSHGAYVVPDWENDTVITLDSEACWEPAK